MIRIAPPPPRRRPGLTAMIDVIFLLLVFFMLAARFGTEGVVSLRLAVGSAEADMRPAVIDLAPEGLRLDGVARDEAGLLARLEELRAEGGARPVVLRPEGNADVQRLVAVLELLRAAGHGDIVVMEGAP